jgi:hypothetical protein
VVVGARRAWDAPDAFTAIAWRAAGALGRTVGRTGRIGSTAAALKTSIFWLSSCQLFTMSFAVATVSPVALVARPVARGTAAAARPATRLSSKAAVGITLPARPVVRKTLPARPSRSARGRSGSARSYLRGDALVI